MPPAAVVAVARVQKVIIRTPGLQVEGQLRTTFEAEKGYQMDDGSPIGVRIDLPGVCSFLVPWHDVRSVEYRPLPVNA